MLRTLAWPVAHMTLIAPTAFGDKCTCTAHGDLSKGGLHMLRQAKGAATARLTTSPLVAADKAEKQRLQALPEQNNG